MQEKVAKAFRKKIGIYLPDKWMEIAPNPEVLASLIAQRDVQLKLKMNMENEEFLRTNKKLYKKSLSGLDFAVNFLQNNIPSELYNMRYAGIIEELDRQDKRFIF